MIKVFLISLAASLGAAAVAWGIRLESLGEKDWYRDIGDFRSSKLKARRGLRWVFWGVVAEMALGFALAVWDGWDISQATTVWILVVEYQLVARTAFQNIRG